MKHFICCYAVSLLLLANLFCIVACRHERASDVEEPLDTLVTYSDSTIVRDLAEIIYEEEAEDVRLDSTFVDFLFTFVYSNRLLRERVVQPMPHIDVNSNVTLLEDFDAAEELAFLTGDFFTMLYANREEEERIMDTQDSIVHVERIMLHDRKVRSYEFQQRKGRWTLVSFRDTGIEDSDISDFLNFYAQFSEDSLFQQSRIAQPLRLVMADPDDEDSYIEGVIDADQWTTFAPDLPQGELTNIRRGQQYTGHRMVLQKNGISNGMQEVFTFDHAGPHWRLISYEN